MSLAEFIDNEEITFRQGALIVAGWFLLLVLAGIGTYLYTFGW